MMHFVATHNAGWSKLHVAYTPEERQRGESAEAYDRRIGGNFEALRSKLSGLETDQNLVTFGNVRIAVVQGNQAAQVFYENHKAIEEQVITGMHLMPILLVRNYGTAETYGTAQFEIIHRQVEAVNRSVKRILERLYNFELALMWGETPPLTTVAYSSALVMPSPSISPAPETGETATIVTLRWSVDKPLEGYEICARYFVACP